MRYCQTCRCHGAHHPRCPDQIDVTPVCPYCSEEQCKGAQTQDELDCPVGNPSGRAEED